MRESLRGLALLAALVGAVPFAFAQADLETTTASAQKKGNINLALNGVGADEAFDTLAKQAGVDLIVNDQQLWANADPVDITVKDGYFWPTFLEMCQQARIQYNPHHGQGRAIQLHRSGGNTDFPRVPRAEYQGTIIQAISATHTTSIAYQSPGVTNSSFNVQFTIFLDPSVEPMGYMQVSVTDAVDDQGNSLAPNQREGAMYGGNGRSLIANVGANLNYSPKAGKKIASLKGFVRTSAVTKSERLEIENPLKMEPVTKDTANYEITIQPLRKTGQADQKSYETKVIFRAKDRPAGGIRNQFNDLWPMMNAIEIRDADGRRLNNGGSGGGGGSTGVYEYTLNVNAFPPNSLGEPAKLIWRVPTEVREIRIPFEFKDLPIP